MSSVFSILTLSLAVLAAGPDPLAEEGKEVFRIERGGPGRGGEQRKIRLARSSERSARRNFRFRRRRGPAQ